jgi:renalase
MTNAIHDVAVIGAGISGLSAAKRLLEAGLDVVVVEKSRGLGGRAATRRVSVGNGIEVPVDHGAQFFTARDPRFQDQVARWQEEGICFPWSDGFMTWSDGSLRGADTRWKDTRYACRGGMNQLGKKLGETVDVVREFQVASVSRDRGQWHLHADPAHESSPVLARALLVSAPIPQAMKLVGPWFSTEQHEFANRVVYGPTVAVMVVYGEGTLQPSWHGIQVRDPSSPISWMAWDSSKRIGGNSGGVAVIHGSPSYSSGWLAASGEDLKKAGAELLREAAKIGGVWMNDSMNLAVHRWRYAHPEGPCAPGGFLKASCDEPLYLIGDGLNGGRVEGAWLSGTFGAEDLLLGSF